VSKNLYKTGYFNFCYPDFFIDIIPTQHIPNDEYFDKQFYLHNTGQVINEGRTGTPGADIKAPLAWEITKGSSTRIIAVIDNGVTSNHPDLPNSRQVRLSSSNFASHIPATSWNINGQNNNDPSPPSGTWTQPGTGVQYTATWYNVPISDPERYNNLSGHGNACAGIIAASMDNNEGIAGIAPQCKIMPIRVWFGTGQQSYLAQALNFSLNNGAHIVSNSWGIESNDPNLFPSIKNSINSLIAANKIVVFGAGNTANMQYGTNGFVIYPANATEAHTNPIDKSKFIVVGGSDRYDTKALFSPVSQLIDISAPTSRAAKVQDPSEGSEVWTITQPGQEGYNPRQPDGTTALPSAGVNHLAYTGMMSGTSASCPQVAAVAALMTSVNPCLNNQQIKNILIYTADKVGGYNYNWNINKPGHSLQLGYGRLNAYEAVKKAQELRNTPDLAVRDTPDDLGFEPNIISSIFWDSKSIWIRNQQDGLVNQTHQNAEYSPNQPVYVYVRVDNLQCTGSPSINDAELELYWTKAGTASLWPHFFDGTILLGGTTPMGGAIGSTPIPLISSNNHSILEFEWYPPDPEDYSHINNEPWHFCLLARINSSLDPMTIPEYNQSFWNTYNNNNIAGKNVTIVQARQNSNPGGGVISVSNIYGINKEFDLIFQPFMTLSKPFTREIEVKLHLDDVLFEVWNRGEKQMDNIRFVRGNEFIITGDSAKFKNLHFNPNEIGTMNVTFSFLSREMTETLEYTYQVIQKQSEDNSIEGGENYFILKQYREPFQADAGENQTISIGQNVALKAREIFEPALYNWYNEKDSLLHTGKNFNISPAKSQKFKLEVISQIDGLKDYDTTFVKVKNHNIDNIYPNPATTDITIDYSINNINQAHVLLLGLHTSYYQVFPIDIQTNQRVIPINPLPNDTYTVILFCDGEAVEARTLVINK
jgi:subtilisin family serine protease